MQDDLEGAHRLPHLAAVQKHAPSGHRVAASPEPASAVGCKPCDLVGVEELIMGLHEIAEVLSRPVLARLAKIGRVAEQVVDAAPVASNRDR
jgi:hypothetical protein